MANGDTSIAALAASLTQLFPTIQRVVDGARFLFDQPVTRVPYYLSTSAQGGQVIAAGQQNVPLLLSDFSHSLAYPFSVRKIKPMQDPQHTARDWSVMLTDQNFAQQLMKNPVMVDGLIDNNTGMWELGFPWIIRPQGGAWVFNVNNLDTVNPIQIGFTLHGELLVPAGDKL
jgi:hypothetical protein